MCLLVEIHNICYSKFKAALEKACKIFSANETRLVFLSIFCFCTIWQTYSKFSYFIHSALARALDLGDFALLTNLDLSSAFDIVNVNLLLKRMRIAGLPISVWSFCVPLVRLDQFKPKPNLFQTQSKRLIFD